MLTGKQEGGKLTGTISYTRINHNKEGEREARRQKKNQILEKKISYICNM